MKLLNQQDKSEVCNKSMHLLWAIEKVELEPSTAREVVVVVVAVQMMMRSEKIRISMHPHREA